MSNTFSFEEASQPAPAAGGDQAPKTFSFEEASGKPAPKGFMGHARDLGISALQGAIGVPEMAVGLADIPTGGAVGKFLENKDGAVGFRPKQAREFLDTLKTDATQQQKTEFEQADGVMGKAGYALSNPSLISNAVAESLPVMGAGGLIGRGVMAAAPKLGAAVAAGAGEGIAAAGSTAEQIRQETKDGELTAGQSALALGAGAATGAFGVAGAKVAKKLGIADADALLVQGAKGMAADAAQQAAMKSIPRKVIEGAIAEGFLEELPQSASEQIIQNIALDRPWSDGVESSVVLGVLSGMAMGGGATLVQGSAQRKAADGSPAGEQDAPQDAPPRALPAPTYTGTPNDQMLQAEAERANAVAEAEARAAEIYQQRADFEAAKQGQPEQPPVNAGLELVRQAYAAQLDALQQQEQDQAAVPQSSPPDGRAALEAQAAQAQAQREADRAVMGPDDEILQSTGAVEPPHRAMGIDPAAGPLSAGAAIAVDTGVAGQMQAAAQAAQSQPAGTEKAAQPAPSAPGELRPNAADAVQAAVSDAAARAAQAGLPMPEGKAVVEQAAQDQITRSTPDLVRQFADTAAKDPAIMRRVAAGTPEQMDAAMALAVPANAPQRDRLMRNDGFASAMRQALQGVAANPAARWDSMFGPEREALAGSLGLPPVIARNIPRAKWATLNPDLQARISKAMAPADGASPSAPAQGSQNGRTADLQDNARLAAQGGAQGRADVDGGTGDLVQRPDGAAGTRVGAAAAIATRSREPAEPAGTTGGGRGAVGQAAPFRPKNLVQLVREAGGVSIDRKADINQDSRTVGVFRKGGMDLDGLAELLQQNGFMTDADVRGSTSGAERAAELLRAALAGERVLSMNDIDEAMGRDAEAQYREEIRRKAAEYGIRTTFRPFGDVEREVLARDGELAPEDRSEFEYGGDVAYTLEPLDDIDLQDARTISEEDQMRMAGFSEDEINETINGTGFRESQGAPEQAQSGTAQESRDAGAQEDQSQEGSSEGLTSYTNEDIARQEAAQRATAADSERAQREADQKAQADAERDTFALTGSDRAADVMAAQGQGGLFDAPTAANQEPIKNETRANAGPAPADRASDQEPIKNPAPAVGNAPSPLEALFSDLNSDSTRKANKAKKAAAKLPEAARIEYVQANFHDILMQMMEAGALEVNGFATLTEDNAPCL